MEKGIPTWWARNLFLGPLLFPLPTRAQPKPPCSVPSLSSGQTPRVPALAPWRHTCSHRTLWDGPMSPACHPLRARIGDHLSLPYGAPVSDSSLPRRACLLQQLCPSSPEIPLDRPFFRSNLADSSVLPDYKNGSPATSLPHLNHHRELEGNLVRTLPPNRSAVGCTRSSSRARKGVDWFALFRGSCWGWFRGSGPSAAGRISHPRSNTAAGSHHAVGSPYSLLPLVSILPTMSVIFSTLHSESRIEVLGALALECAAPVTSAAAVFSAPSCPCADWRRRVGGRWLDILRPRLKMREWFWIGVGAPFDHDRAHRIPFRCFKS
jgi:hypothetical protein